MRKEYNIGHYIFALMTKCHLIFLLPCGSKSCINKNMKQMESSSFMQEVFVD